MTSRSQDEEFQARLIEIIPRLRAFARSLTSDSATADDMAQDALARAWSKRHTFQPDTNLRAWVFTICRNGFYSHGRRSGRFQPLDPQTAERTPAVPINPDARMELDEVRRAIAALPIEQREAVVLVGAGGLSYGEAAQICGVPQGTIKSRVARARQALAARMVNGDFAKDELDPGVAMVSIISQTARICAAKDRPAKV